MLDPSLHPLVNLALQPCNGLRSQPDRLRELALAHEEVDVGAAVARSCNHFGQAEELSWRFHGNSFLEGVENDSWVYFVHSYRVKPNSNDIITAESDYGIKVPAVVEQDNFFGTQFHPEKSSSVGKIMIMNFGDQSEDNRIPKLIEKTTVNTNTTPPKVISEIVDTNDKPYLKRWFMHEYKIESVPGEKFEFDEG